MPADPVEDLDPKRFYTTPAEARFFERWIAAHLLALYVFLAVAYFLRLPSPLLALGLIFPVRMYLALHELMHAPVKRVNPVVLYLMAFGSFSPANFRMQRHSHLNHHRFVNDPRRDPDHPRADQPSFAAAFVRNLAQTEETAIYYFRTVGIRASDVAIMILNAATTGGMFYLFGWGFLWFFIPFRIATTIAYTQFSYLLHKGPGRALSTYDGFQPPLWPSALGRFTVWLTLGGEHFLNGMRYHRIHHQNASFSLFHLEEATRLFLREDLFPGEESDSRDIRLAG
jgi:fatty acid desaturase